LSRIVLSTFGSLGDLHPYLALGAELRARGHGVVLATHALYGDLAASAGLEFAPVRPDLAALEDRDEVFRRAMDLRRGSEYVLRQMVLKPLRETTADLLGICAGADLVVGHAISIGSALAAEKLGIPRVHAVLQPMAMWSAHDPARMPALLGSGWLPALPPAAWRVIWAAGRASSRTWFGEVGALRRDLGLPATRAHPVLEMWSEHLNLALFSPIFGPPQPDWPARTIATGFPEWASPDGWSAALQAFLDAGEPPVVFTLGSSAVMDARGFFEESVAAVRGLGVRAMFLTGPDGRNPLPSAAGDPRLLAVEYASHARLFPRAAAIVHQGGIGTTARALASGRPMLVVPHSHDQPDNAARCERLGVARVMARARYRADRAARSLRALLGDGAVCARAAELGARISAERGAATAADAIGALLAGRGGAGPGDESGARLVSRAGRP
jgi:rhamnosyltransferase subunit B